MYEVSFASFISTQVSPLRRYLTTPIKDAKRDKIKCAMLYVDKRDDL